MKISIDIMALILCAVLIFPPLYAGNLNDQPNHLFSLSPLLTAKPQIIPDIGGHIKSAKFCSPVLINVLPSDEPSPTYKDRSKAFIRSLILPGAGEYYLGKRIHARAFFFTEVALWISYFACREYSNWVRDDAFAFAATHSGAKIAGKPSQFLVDIGNYPDVYQYNDAKQRMYQFNKVYASEDYFWSWDSDNNRRKFDQMRITSDRALNSSVFVLGGIFANHLISAIHSVWQTHRYNKKLEQTSAVAINFHVESMYSNNKIVLTIQRSF